jgi:hypothetical protein
LQDDYIKILAMFASQFSATVWEQAQVLVTGTILARGQRTVASALRVMGLGDRKDFENYHRVLNRAEWCARTVSQILLKLVIETFAPGEIVIGGDETIERRRGDQIAAKGIYRDPVRSSKSHFVKASGLRWVTMMVLAGVPFAHRIWALPFMTILAPSERFHQRTGRRHKTLPDWMRQGLLQVRRWLPDRRIIFVGDASYAVFDLLWRMTQLKNPIIMVTRFRMDAALYEPAPERLPGTKGRPRKKGARKPSLLSVVASPDTVWTEHVVRYWYGEFKRCIEITSDTAFWYHSGKPLLPIRWVIIRDPLGRFEPQVLVCTDLSAAPGQIVEWFIQRWQMEVTHREVREHLGVETQRQWSNKAIARSTPALFGLFSIVTLLAQRLAQRGKVIVRRTAWYAKPLPTFTDAIAAVRFQLWRSPDFHTSTFNQHIAKLPDAVFNAFASALCYLS